MKIQQVTEAQKNEITGLLEKLRPAIEKLRAADERLTDFQSRASQNHSVLADLSGIELPADKEISATLIARERETILNGLIAKTERTAFEQRAPVASLASEAVQLFHRITRYELFSKVDSELLEILPEQIREDRNLLFRLTGENKAKQTVGRFLNPPAINPRADDNSIAIAEATRLADLLDALVSGREITVPGLEGATA